MRIFLRLKFGYLLVNILGKHRSRIRILAKILSVVNENNGAKKTHIMYNAYLSYELLTRYLTDLINANLIIYGDDNNYMLTTDRGEVSNQICGIL